MNLRQVAGQIEKRATDRTWSEGGGNKVFGSVKISSAPPGRLEDLEDLTLPALLIRTPVDRPDAKLPGLSSSTFFIEIIVAVAGDQFGRSAIMGHGVQDRQKSSGKGLLWTERELKAIIRQITNVEGIRVVGRRTGAQRSGVHAELGHIATRIYELTVQVTDEPYYHPPTRVVATDLTGGDARITWADPPTRFDTRTTTPIMIRRAAGATAPASETAGDLVARVALGTETYTDSPGAGQFSYALFAAYSDTGADSEEAFSDQETGTTRTVTVT